MARRAEAQRRRKAAFIHGTSTLRSTLLRRTGRAGWVGCNTPINSDESRAGNIGEGHPLNQVPAEARIAVVTTILSPPQSSAGVSPAPPSNSSEGRRDACATLSRGESVVVTPAAEVRERFRRVKPLKDIPVTQSRKFGTGRAERRAPAGG